MQGSKGFAHIMLDSKGHLDSSGEVTEQEQFGVRVLRELGLRSGKAQRRYEEIPWGETLQQNTSLSSSSFSFWSSHVFGKQLGTMGAWHC